MTLMGGRLIVTDRQTDIHTDRQTLILMKMLRKTQDRSRQTDKQRIKKLRKERRG